MPGNRRRGIIMNSEFLEQAKGQIGDTKQELSALTCAMIAQAEAMERIAVAMERQAAVMEKMAARQEQQIRWQVGDYGPIGDGEPG
jgi:hypothetical protein